VWLNKPGQPIPGVFRILRFLVLPGIVIIRRTKGVPECFEEGRMGFVQGRSRRGFAEWGG